MDLLEELLRLEGAKHKALVSIDAPAYEETVREQMRVLAASENKLGGVTNVKGLQALSQLISVNTRLLQNLFSATPLFYLSANGYTSQGLVSEPALSRRVSVEA